VVLSSILAAVKQNTFLKHNAIFFAGSVAVGVLNYAYYPVLGRLMNPAAFGEIQVLVSLFLQFTIFLNVLSLITVSITVNYSDSSKAHRMIFELEKLASYIALGLLILSIVGGGFLQQKLHFESQLPFVALALAMLVSIPLTFRSAYARGQKRFGIASMSQLIGAGTKIMLSAGLVVLGTGVTGAIGGIAFAQFLAFLYAARYAARLGFSRPSDTNYGTLPDLKLVLPELKYAGAVFIGLLAITMAMTIDVIVVKYFFDARTAGLYAGVATVARIIFFLATPISQVLMPMVKADQSNEKNYQLFKKSLLLTIVICGFVLLVCTVMPAFIMKVLMGVEYITYASLLPPLALAILLISIANLNFMFILALRQKMIMLIGIISFAMSLSFLLIWHHDLQAVVLSMLGGSIFTLVATGIYVLVNLRRGVRHAE
jgi:O-antigen/teichoic acid export membrane protein